MCGGEGVHGRAVCVAGGLHGRGGMHARGVHGGGVSVHGGCEWQGVHGTHAPCGQTDTCENITSANFVCGR